MEENKYFEALKQYDLDLDDEKVKFVIEAVVKAHDAIANGRQA